MQSQDDIPCLLIFVGFAILTVDNYGTIVCLAPPAGAPVPLSAPVFIAAV